MKKYKVTYWNDENMIPIIDDFIVAAKSKKEIRDKYSNLLIYSIEEI